MSVKVMGAVWEHSPQKENKLLALLAIADNANDDGWAYPSQVTLAKKCRVQRRAIQKILDDLESLNEIVIYNRVDPAHPQQHFSNVYHLPKYGNPAAPHPLELRGEIKPRREEPNVQKDTTGGSVQSDRGGDVQKDTTLANGGTLPSVQPDTRVVSGGTHDPLQELSVNPSQEPKIEVPPDPEQRKKQALEMLENAFGGKPITSTPHTFTDAELAKQLETALAKRGQKQKAVQLET